MYGLQATYRRATSHSSRSRPLKRFKKILVATDTRLENHAVVDKAAEIAQQNQAALAIVDVVPEMSWIAGKLVSDLEHMLALYTQEVSAKLESLAQPFRDQGMDVATRVLTGKTSVEVVRDVLREKHDLLMVVAKGKNSRRKGFLGYTAIHLLQTCPSAVWLVASETAAQPKHVLGCVDITSDHAEVAELNDRVYELSRSIATTCRARHSLLHAWQMHNESFLSARLRNSLVVGFVQEYYENVKTRYEEFAKAHGSDLSDENVHLIKGRAPDIVDQFVRQNGVDLIVMGTLARTGLAGALIGNTAEQTLDRIECSLLALKPYAFVSPIKLASYTRPTAPTA